MPPNRPALAPRGLLVVPTRRTIGVSRRLSTAPRAPRRLSRAIRRSGDDDATLGGGFVSRPVPRPSHARTGPVGARPGQGSARDGELPELLHPGRAGELPARRRLAALLPVLRDREGLPRRAGPG